jgi:hypothetical protein
MWGSIPPVPAYRRCAFAVVLVCLASLAGASSAFAAAGYAPDSSKPSIPTSAEFPHGVAVDQVSQMLYVAELTTDQISGGPGRVEQFDSNGVATAASPFTTGVGGDYFAGVAVNPTNQSLYAYQVQIVTPSASFGTAAMNVFSSTGTLGTSFAPSKTTAAQLATDELGRVYFPSDSTASIQVYSSAGVLAESISCSACPGGAFSEPASVALDSAKNLYAVDMANGGRVVKFKQSAGKFVYDSVLQSGKGAGAVGVDPSNNTVFVGDLGSEYHVVAYNSSGVQIDDFGAGLFALPPLVATVGQIAANATTHKVYVADAAGKQVLVFEPVASIPGPTGTTDAASQIGQLDALLNSTINPKGHGLTACTFKYSEDADYQLNGFANATVIPCSQLPGGTQDVPITAHPNGLTPATKYDFQVSAASNGGSMEGTVRNFTTLNAAAPEATTAAPASVSQTVVKLAGTVNPKGGQISACRFELVTAKSFLATGFTGAKKVECAPKTPTGTSGVPVTGTLLGLTAATEYRFRIIATSNAGTTETPAAGFSTLADTCATKPALCPPPEEPAPGPGPSPSTPASTPPAASAPSPTPPPVVTPKPLKCRAGFVKKRVHGKLKCVKRKRHRHR